MLRKKYTSKQKEELRQNPYVIDCPGVYISFTTEAKIKSIELWQRGITAREIFRELGFPTFVINSNIPRKCLERWRRVVKLKGMEGLKSNKKGRPLGSVKKIDTTSMTPEQYTRFLETELLYIRKENQVLKGLKKNEPNKTERFQIIHELSKNNCITTLCLIAKVSLSGYYAYKTRLQYNNTKECREKEDYEIIKELALKSKRRAGYRTITMQLYNSERRMNHKKVYRLMKKYDCLSKTRRSKPYRGIMKATLEHRTAKNLLNREFKKGKPYEKFGTDITYLKYNGINIYLSIIKDIISGEIVSSHLSSSLSIEIIGETLKELELYKKNTKTDFTGSVIHSDQGTHYTHPRFSLGISKMGLIQSMSRRGNCLDNAPTESFFGHMKDEIDISSCKNINEARKHIDNYMYHYNNTRPQWNKKKMTPVEYRNHLLSQSANQPTSF